MAGIPKEHDKLYFDKLIRTQKLESVLSLIHATYRAKTDNPTNFERKHIAERLMNGYNLFRNKPKGQVSGTGSYVGDEKQFESQYTIGHEMSIWKNSNLDLTDKAKLVAENKITIRDYFDIFFLNYFQPINGKNVCVLHSILIYMKNNNLKEIDKDEIPEALGVESDKEDLNALCNFLDGTNFLSLIDNSKLTLKNNDINSLIKRCNIKYSGKIGYELSLKELNDDQKYSDYIMSETVIYEKNQDNRELLQIDSNATVFELANKLKEMYNSPEYDKVLSIHLFGIIYGVVIRNKGYSVQQIVDLSGINASYFAEVNKGIKLSGFVDFNSDKSSIFYDKKTTLDLNNLRKPRIDKVNNLNTILYGAPGTGKTYSTIEMAISIVENKKISFLNYTNKEREKLIAKFTDLAEKGRVTFTTFHQSYSYEDFIEGLRPDSDGNFKYTNGVFKSISEKAASDPINDYVLIIDEINRGNISKIFGELITLIEDDKRIGEINGLYLVLPSGNKFSVPNNLYIVGTMNSADKSISLIDTALRRRFVFIEKPVNLDLIKVVELKNALKNMNDFLKKELRSTDLLIGHSYFISKALKDAPDILNNSIIPLLYEYFYDDEIKVAKAIEVSKLAGIKIIRDGLGRIKVEQE